MKRIVHVMTRIAAMVAGANLKKNVIPALLAVNVSKILTVKGGAAII